MTATPAAPHPSPRRHPHPRRVASALTVSLVLAVVAALQPAGAWASFTGRDSGAVSVSTATLTAPSTMTLTTTCPTVLTAGSVTVTFPDAAVARSYSVTLDQPLTPTVTRTITSGVVGSTFVLPRNLFGLFTVSVTSKAGSWTSSTTSRTVTCLAV